jgi:hypothetical protein
LSYRAVLRRQPFEPEHGDLADRCRGQAAEPQVVGLLGDVAAARSIDVFALVGQPSVWCGVQNPFAMLSRQPSPDDVYVVNLDPAAPQFTPRLPSRMRKNSAD